MTAPRQVLPDTVTLVTRRCLERRFLLRPSRSANRIFLYILAVAARRYRIQVHAYCVLSNHYHLIVSDPFALLPAFIGFIDSLVARAFNAINRRKDRVWDGRQFSAVALLDREAVIDKAAYVLANPVAAGLVARACQWPGLWSDPARWTDGPAQVERPRQFFAADGDMPKMATLELTPPAGFATMAEFRDAVVPAFEAREDEARRRRGHRFLGVARVLRQQPTASPMSEEPPWSLSPKVASTDAHVRMAALAGLKEFLRQYRRALAARLLGFGDVLFPGGTYLLRLREGVPCAESG